MVDVQGDRKKFGKYRLGTNADSLEQVAQKAFRATCMTPSEWDLVGEEPQGLQGNNSSQVQTAAKQAGSTGLH